MWLRVEVDACAAHTTVRWRGDVKIAAERDTRPRAPKTHPDDAPCGVLCAVAVGARAMFPALLRLL